MTTTNMDNIQETTTNYIGEVDSDGMASISTTDSLSSISKNLRTEYMRIYMQTYRTREYKYYLNMRIQCPICDKMTARTHIARHQKSELCKRIKEIKEKKNFIRNK